MCVCVCVCVCVCSCVCVCLRACVHMLVSMQMHPSVSSFLELLFPVSFLESQDHSAPTHSSSEANIELEVCLFQGRLRISSRWYLTFLEFLFMWQNEREKKNLISSLLFSSLTVSSSPLVSSCLSLISLSLSLSSLVCLACAEQPPLSLPPAVEWTSVWLLGHGGIRFVLEVGWEWNHRPLCVYLRT